MINECEEENWTKVEENSIQIGEKQGQDIHKKELCSTKNFYNVQNTQDL